MGLLACFILFPDQGLAQESPDARSVDNPRIVLLDMKGNRPSAPHVVDHLAPSLARVSVDVAVRVTREQPGDDTRVDMAREAAKDAPGTLAVVDWRCADRRCVVCIVDTATWSIVTIPVEPQDTMPVLGEHEDAPDEADARCVSGVIREFIYGSSLFELGRVVEYSARTPLPADKPVSYQVRGEKPPPGEEKRASRDLLWLEVGYVGAYPFPLDSTVHGILAGAVFYPHKHLVPAVHVGWMGVRRNRTSSGEVVVSALPVMLSLRFSFPLGPALLGLAPAFRIDPLLVRKQPAGEEKERKGGFECSLGGMVTWNFPMPLRNMEVVLGTAAMATLASDDYFINQDRILSGTTVDFLWFVGGSWGLRQR